ncbi:hypothetical protein NVP1084O_083 [Vibrio phage 1.084.O._10N.261.49.F5]|nr:hypothetical protein NVP1084O_083 [Vibrio phage 1.084.O._10N.261.49.F5]
MTTVIIDAVKKVAYSDSCTTNTKLGVKGVFYTHNAEKIHKHKSGNLLAVSFGCVNIAYPKLIKLGFKVKTPMSKVYRRNWVHNSEDSAGMLIIGKSTDQIVHIRSVVDKITLKVTWKTQILENMNRAWAGSGVDTGIPDKLFRYKSDFDYGKVIKACSLLDKSTDDKVQMMRLK